MQPESILLLELMLGLVLYAVLGGADCGVGVWDFNHAFRASPEEYKFRHDAMGPVWEANHVWLIFVLMLMWNGFPLAFAAITQLIMGPLWLGLMGIVFRGAAYALSGPQAMGSLSRRLWDVVFGLSSVLAPFCFGAAFGVLSKEHPTITFDRSTWSADIGVWLNLPCCFLGMFAVGICAYISAAFLTRDASLQRLANLELLWRRRALWVGSLCGVMAMAGIAIAWREFPSLFDGLRVRAWPLVLASVASGAGGLILLALKHYSAACVCVGLAIATVLCGWAVAMYPYFLMPHLTIAQCSSPKSVIVAMNISIAIGCLVLAPSLGWLLWLFKNERP